MRELCVLVVAVCLVSCDASSTDTRTAVNHWARDESGTCGEGLMWSFNSNTSRLTVSGTGLMTNYSPESPPPWKNTSLRIEYVVFEEGVGSIGAFSFAGFGTLGGVSIPSSVQFIGESAFENCSYLLSVRIPAGVASIQDNAFHGCRRLGLLDVGPDVISIGESAFLGCLLLSTVKYFGTSAPECGGRVFNSVKSYCVPVDYSSQYFCNNSVPSNMTEYSNHNHCYQELVCTGGETIVKKRENATSWESRSNECVEYFCDNNTGGKNRSICVDSEGTSRVCTMDEKCVETETNGNDDDDDGMLWRVEIDIESIKTSACNISDVIGFISNVSNVDLTNVTIKVEVNQNNEIVRIIIFFQNEET